MTFSQHGASVFGDGASVFGDRALHPWIRLGPQKELVIHIAAVPLHINSDKHMLPIITEGEAAAGDTASGG